MVFRSPPAGHRSFVVRISPRRAHQSSNGYRWRADSSIRRASEPACCLDKSPYGADPLAELRKAAAAAGQYAAINLLKNILVARRSERTASSDRSTSGERCLSVWSIHIQLQRDRLISEIKRSDLSACSVDKVDDSERGASMADHVLAILRRIMVWHMSRSDDFRSPIVRGMARTSPKERARERHALNRQELRAIWRTADDLRTPFARMLQFILLTAVRRNEAARMDRSEISGTEWVIPAARFKGKRDFLVPLTAGCVSGARRASCDRQCRTRACVYVGWNA